MATEIGLRETKKMKTRQHIADIAARLFGERGFEQVSVADVARAAEVSEQTIYNYFTTKHDLVLDRADEIRSQLVGLVADRAVGRSPAAALREAAHVYGARVRRSSVEQLRGELPVLSAGSPTIRRLLLESRDHTAQDMAGAIVATTAGIHPTVARVQAIALVSVFQIVVDHIGRRIMEGADPQVVADELRELIDAALDDLDRHWLNMSFAQ